MTAQPAAPKPEMQSKRFVTIAEYQRITGLSYKTVKNALDTGQLKGIKTEAGHWKVDITDSGDKATVAIIEQLNEQGRLLRQLCSHLGLLTATER